MSTRPNSESAFAAIASTSSFLPTSARTGERLDPEIPRLARDGLSLLLVGARVDDDMRAFAGQLQHRRAADIAPRAGDQRDFPFELAHDRSPLADQLGLSVSACDGDGKPVCRPIPKRAGAA